MNSFSNMQLNDKTFSGFQIKRNQDTINQFNDKMKNTQNTMDVNMFEQTSVQNTEDGLGFVDFDTDRNAQKQITIQTNKTNVLASEQAYLDANTANETNPILHDGELRRKQRSNTVRLQEEVNKVAPGRDSQSIFQQTVVKEQNKLIKKQHQDMVDNRVQFTQKPIDLEYSKKADVERHLLKQTIDNTMKLQHDYNNFQAKGVQDAKAEKRIPVVPMMGLQMQQNQVLQHDAPETIFRSQGNRMEPILETGGVKTTIPFSDVNIGRIVRMPKEIGKFVMLNTYGNIHDSYSQPVQSLEVTVPKQKNNFHNYSHTLITGIKNVFAPKPIMQQEKTNKYIHQPSINIPQNAPQISRATDLKVMNTNKPNFHDLATQSRQAQTYGPDMFNFEGL